jgi:transposase InsO family protein
MIGDEMKLHTSVSALAVKPGMGRQNFYKGRRARRGAEADACLAERLVRRERALQPRPGGRKLFKILAPVLGKEGIKLGRGRFFDILSGKGLLVPPLPKSPVTTRFEPGLPVFRNPVSGLELSGPDRAWAAITYIRTGEGFPYLSLITDMWPRKIAGLHAGDSLETEGALSALAMAPASPGCGAKPVHHSDRGRRYASRLYVGKLREAGLQTSMTEELHCYENAAAERVNGILKQEYYIGSCFRNKDQAGAAVKEAVYLYNTRRPHMSLDYETPDKTHGIAA